MEEFDNIEITEVNCVTTGAKIKAIGVGGGGGNMINHMIQEGICSGIDLIVANTDAQALDSSLAPYKMQLGLNATRGLGAGMRPEKGREAALESFEDIKKMLEGSDIVFISAGLGGGTGTGAAPIIAQAAKEVGALTISVVTSPFKLEGAKRRKLANEGLEELKRESDAIVVVQNEKLRVISEKKVGIKNAFKQADDVLAQAVGGISSVILSPGKNDINLDFADVRTVIGHKGLALMGTGYASGNEKSGYEAAKNAIESPLFDHISIDGAMGVLIHYDCHPDYPLEEIMDALETIYEFADENADIIFGTSTHEDMEVDEIKITIVATGFENKTSVSEPTATKQKTLSLSNTADLNTIKTKRVVGGYNGDNEDILEVPTFLRKQMD